MKSFDAYANCLFDDLEGGESDSNIDPGGYTIWGFSKPTRQRLNLGDVLTRDEAKRALELYYWHPFQCDTMHPAVAWLVSDANFNHRPKTAALIIQAALGNVTVDG
ncbi:MAG: hypothetical protein GY954_19935, partial [Alteromonas sp.]|nr:hypothetical protein [Alteromonas sp.]